MGSDSAVRSPLRTLVRAEFAQAFRSPYEVPIVVAANGALMSGAWFLLPSWLKDWLFTLHGPLAFAVVLAGWMYSDVPATNVLAPDRKRVLEAIDDPAALRRILFARNIVLWLLVAPLCMLLAIVIGISSDRWPPTLLSIVAIAVVPFGALGIAAWVGILLPYHPLGLRERWEHRRPVVHTVRWLALVLVPYVLVPALATLVVLPSFALWAAMSPRGLHGRLPDDHLAAGIVLACVVSAAAWFGGHRVGIALAGRHRDKLVSYLGARDLG
ncbi:MAG: hypothetical protein ACHQNA_01900 [Acidimicrobiales bacterium]